MGRKRFAFCVLAPAFMLLAAAVPTRAFAQAAIAPRPAARSWFKGVYVSVSGGYQAATNTFANTWTYEYFAEDATVSARYPVKPAFLVDIGGGIRVFRDLSVGAAFSRYTRSDPAGVDASVPHPFFLNQLRPLAGSSGALGRTETAVHIQAMWTISVAPRMRLGLFGGPSAFSIKQVLINDLNYAESYPYDTVTLAGVASVARSNTKVGFNAGLDFTVLLYRQFGVGAFVRYSGATTSVSGPGGASVSLKAGGLQGGVGFRVKFF